MRSSSGSGSGSTSSNSTTSFVKTSITISPRPFIGPRQVSAQTQVIVVSHAPKKGPRMPVLPPPPWRALRSPPAPAGVRGRSPSNKACSPVATVATTGGRRVLGIDCRAGCSSPIVARARALAHTQARRRTRAHTSARTHTHAHAEASPSQLARRLSGGSAGWLSRLLRGHQRNVRALGTQPRAPSWRCCSRCRFAARFA